MRTRRWQALLLLAMAGACGRSETASGGIYGAWFAEGAQGAVVVVQESQFGHASAGRVQDQGHYTETKLHAHLVDSGKHLGTMVLADGQKVLGAYGERIWLDAPDGPKLVSMLDLSVTSDRAAIVAAVGSAVGGDFRPTTFVDLYTGRLAVDGADGKTHWIDTSLEHHTNDEYEERRCRSDAEGLIKAIGLVCLPPGSAPVVALSVSSVSALDDAKGSVLSGVQQDGASNKPTVAWTKPVAELVPGAVAPVRHVQTQVLAPDRAVVMLASGDKDPQLHVLSMKPKDGTVSGTKTLFEGPATPGKSPP